MPSGKQCLLAYIAGSTLLMQPPQKKDYKLRSLLVMLCALAIVPGDTLVYSQTSPQSQPTASSDQAAKPEEQAAKIPADQLDSLVAPIAL